MLLHNKKYHPFILSSIYVYNPSNMFSLSQTKTPNQFSHLPKLSSTPLPSPSPKPMGFPSAYTQVFFPKLFLHLLSLLGLIRALVSTVLAHLGLQHFLQQENFSYQDHPTVLYPPVSATLIRELLPVVKFEEACGESPQGCAVCLYEVEEGEEIRWLSNCKHIFHMGCLDRWMDHDQKTCPLCRTNFVPFGLQDVFNQRLWDACGITDDYNNSEYNSVPVF